MTRFALLMAASILAGSALAQNRVIDEKWDVRNGPARRMQLQWFAGESVELNLEPTYGRDAADLDGSTIVWTVADFDAPTNVYIQATGTVASAIATVELTHEQANLPEGTYSGWVSAESSNQVSILAYQTIKVTWSPASGSWAVAEGNPIFASAILVAAISNDLAAAIALKADASALSTTSNALAQATALKADSSDLSETSNSLAQAVALKANASDLSATSNALAQAVSLKASTSALSTASNTLAQAVALKANASDLSATSNTFALALGNLSIGDPNALSGNLLVTSTAPLTLVVSNGLVYAVLPNGDMVDVTYYLPAYAVTEPTANYPAGFAAFDFVASTTNVSALAPQIAEWTRQNQPGDTMALTAENLDPTNSLFVFSDDGSEVLAGDILMLDDRQCAVTLPDGLASNSFYLAWPYNSEGFGEPVGINQADLWWCNSSVATGSMFRVFGQNLELDGTSHLYIKELNAWLSTTNCNPYMAQYTLPASATAGTYTVYAHNGHGGTYGWSGPLVIEVWNGYQFSDDTNTWYNVTDYGLVLDGVTDNSAALRALWNTVKNDAWPTIYFPAGTNFLGGTTANTFSGGTCNGARFIGDGTNSVQKTQVDAYRGFAFNFARNKIIVKDMVFLKQQIMTSSYCPVVLTGGNNLIFDSVVFDDRSVGVDSPGTYMAMETFGNNNYFTNCSFIIDNSIYSSGENYTFDDCSFMGIWDNNGLLYANGEGLALIDCYGSSYDNSNAALGNGWAKGRWIVSHNSSANWYIGDCVGTNLYPRKPTANYTAIPISLDPPAYSDTALVNGKLVEFSTQTVWFADIPDSSSRSVYLQVPPENHRFRIVELDAAEDFVVVRYESWMYDGYPTWSLKKFDNWEISLFEDNDYNSGEMFLKESGASEYRGAPTAWTTNTVTLPALQTKISSFSIGRAATIVKGKGLGQSRIITAMDIPNGVVTLDRNWKVNPDETSVITIGRYATQWAFTGNDLHADVSAFTNGTDSGSAGIQFANGGGAHSVIVDNNVFRGIDVGIYLLIYARTVATSTTNTVSPWYFGKISNNTFLNNNYNILDKTHLQNAAYPYFDDSMLMGMLVRNNVFDGTDKAVFNSVAGSPVDLGYLTVWDSNLVTNLVGSLEISDHARNNDVWINNTFYGTGNGLRLFSNPVALRGNTFTGFSANYYGSLPGSVLQIPQATVLLSDASKTIELYNVGTTELTYTATDNAAWLSVTDSGAIAAESSGDMVLSRSGSTTNGATALVSVVAAGQTNVFTVIYGTELGVE